MPSTFNRTYKCSTNLQKRNGMLFCNSVWERASSVSETFVKHEPQGIDISGQTIIPDGNIPSTWKRCRLSILCERDWGSFLKREPGNFLFHGCASTPLGLPSSFSFSLSFPYWSPIFFIISLPLCLFHHHFYFL